MKKVITIILLLVLIPIVVAQTNNNECGFFCKIENFFSEIFNPQIEDDSSQIQLEDRDDKIDSSNNELSNNLIEKKTEESIDILPSNDKQAKEQQIEIVSDKIIPKSAKDFESENLCDINLDKTSITPSEEVTASYTFTCPRRGCRCWSMWSLQSPVASG